MVGQSRELAYSFDQWRLRLKLLVAKVIYLGDLVFGLKCVFRFRVTYGDCASGGGFFRLVGD